MKLKYLRDTRGISQLKLAMDLSMNQNSISRYENGVREADYATLKKFADYFNVSLDYLLERTDNPDMLQENGFAVCLRRPFSFCPSPRKVYFPRRDI